MGITMWECEKMASHLQDWQVLDDMCKRGSSSCSTVCVPREREWYWWLIHKWMVWSINLFWKQKLLLVSCKMNLLLQNR